MKGPNLDLLKSVCEATDAPVVASGGVSSLKDLHALAELVPHGVEGAIIGKALYAGAFTLPEALVAVAPRGDASVDVPPRRRDPRLHAVIRRISSGGPWRTSSATRAVVAGPGCSSPAPPRPSTARSATWATPTRRRSRPSASYAVPSRTRVSLADVVRTRMYLRTSATPTPSARARRALRRRPPAATMVEVSAFVDPRMLVEVEADAYRA